MLQKRSLILQNHTTLVHTALLHELAISANLRYQGGEDIFVLDRIGSQKGQQLMQHCCGNVTGALYLSYYCYFPSNLSREPSRYHQRPSHTVTTCTIPKNSVIEHRRDVEGEDATNVG